MVDVVDIVVYGWYEDVLIVFVVDEVLFFYGVVLFCVCDGFVDVVVVEVYVVDVVVVLGFVVDVVVFDVDDFVIVMFGYVGF